MSTSILVVEDSDTIIMGLQYSLEQEGFLITIAKDVITAKNNISNNTYDLLLLDVTLTDGTGFDVCKYAKAQKEAVPVIFLTARDEETNVVMGLDMGADDYVIKPFRVRELISRIKSVLRRSETKNSTINRNIITIGDVSIDINQAKVFKNGEEILFTSLEYKILLMLFSNPDTIITREQILDKIWDVAGNFVNDNTLTVYIKRIREKLGDNKEINIIETVRGTGYRIRKN